MPKVRLVAPFWDGYQLHPIDAVVDVEVPPKSAEPIEAPEPRRRRVKSDEAEGAEATDLA